MTNSFTYDVFLSYSKKDQTVVRALARRLATGTWKPSENSTVGAWATQWELPDLPDRDGLEREIWLWDSGVQADQRLVHQLYMDNAADFTILTKNHHMGIKLVRESVDRGDISLYFGPGVTAEEQVLFANYIHGHLQTRCEEVERLRYYVCPYCNAPKGNPHILMEKLPAQKTKAKVHCDRCEKRFPLWDDLEKLFASDEVRERVEGMQHADARRKGKLLVLEVAARITNADQKCFEIPGTEDEGIDMELDFTDDNGKGTGKRLYLQLKCGNSHLEKQKNGKEIFLIKKQQWVKYWTQQPFPVMLVVGTFAEQDHRGGEGKKLEFEAVRWMEISSYLNEAGKNGTVPVDKIEFKGERLDMTSLYKWRAKMLNG